jgi:hypothetical protein
VLRIRTNNLGQGRRSAHRVEESGRIYRLNPMNSKVEKTRRRSEKLVEARENETEEIARIRRLRKADESRRNSKKVEKGRDKSTELVKGRGRWQKVE